MLRIPLLTVLLLLYGAVSLAEQYTIPLFLPATAPGTPQGVLRVVNAGDESGAVAVHAIDDAGVRSGPATFTLGALAAVEFDAADLANGNAGKGLSGGLGAGSDVRRLEIDTELPIEVLAYARAADGTLAVMHGMVPAVSGDEAGRVRYEVHIFNPSVDATQSSRLRLINTGGEVASVKISARDDTGAPASGGEVRLVLPAGTARTLTSWQLEAGDGSIEGRLGAGVGRWRLSVTSDQPIGVVNVAVASAGQWRNLSTVELAEEEADDRAALAALYNATDGANWTNNANWLSNAPIGEWHGVAADENGRVLALELPNNRLSGSIPPELGALTNLMVLNLQNNQLSGTIPAEIGNLSNLQVLILQGNQLSGSIPAEMGALANLQGLILQGNQLSGPIPVALGGLANLEVMDLANNRLSGSIPAELAELANLKVLILQGNQLSGSIPPELGGLANLQTLILGGNEFTGCVPSGLESIADSDFSVLGLPFCDAPAGPDLVILSPSVSDGSPGADESFTLSVTVRNQGDHESAVTTLRYYSSTDATISSSDTELGTEPVSKLAVSREHGGSMSLKAPSSAGIYHYGACVDPVQDEIDTANNCSAAVSVTVRDGDQGVILPSTDDREALVALYNATGGANWTNSANWLSDAPISEWYGVTTDSDGYVTALNLASNRLTGLIPIELRGLTNLEELTLNHNQLSGSVPSELGQLHNLQVLILGDNQLSGPIPVELGRLALLRTLWLNGNQLSGPIPAELGGLTNLTFLSLNGNRLNGPIPAVLGHLANLEILYLGGNQLSGPIPQELGGLANLEVLDLAENQFTGSIPVELGRLAKLRRLGLNSNQLIGPIPAELGGLANLVYIHLGDNPLTGCVPAGWRSMPDNDFSSLGLLFCDEFGVDATLPGVSTSGIFVPEVFSGASLSTGTGGTTMDFDDGGYIQLRDGTLYTCRASDGCQVVNGAVTRGAIQTRVKPDRAVLVALYNAAGGANWTNNANWLSDAPLGEWHGVTVDSHGRVIGLNLVDNQLSGPIPAELGGLANLIYLRLGGNRLSGPIPAELGELLDLTWLHLNGNQLSGPIPVELGKLANLYSLNLDGNPLTGCIPSGWRDVPEDHFSSLGLPFCGEFEVGAALPGVPANGDFSPELISSASVSAGSGGTTIDFDNGGFIQLRNGTLYACRAAVGCQVVNGAVTQGTIRARMEVDRAALVAFYGATGGTNWANNANWLSGAPIGTWHGVAADSNGRVTELILPENGLSGSISAELGRLANLEHLGLFNNQLSGSIPPELGGLANLAILNLDGNQLSGSIPAELGRLANLEHLGLFNNQLSGSIPPELGGLANLAILSLGGNWWLSGPIPVELGRLANLEHLGLFNNQLSGSIPAELGGLTNLVYLDLGDNQLSGSIPVELGRLANLAILNLDGNQLSGPIPVELGRLANLHTLILDGNQLSGPIPVELGRLNNLWRLRLNGNQLSGPIPAELGRLANLAILNLNGNRLSGSIPVELGRLDLGWAYLDGNLLTGCIPSEWREVPNNDFSSLILPFCDEFEVGAALPGVPASGDFSPEFISGASVSVGSDATTIDFDDGGYIQLRDGVRYTCQAEDGCQAVNGVVTQGTFVSGMPPDDRSALVALYNATGGVNWTNSANWLSSAPIGEWHGVVTDSNGRVTELLLYVNQLSGSIPAELGGLANLVILNLAANQLSGPIPAELGGLANLVILNLAANQLSGPIPAELGGLANLEHLGLEGNLLSGPIPAELGGLTNLEHLILGGNQLSGPIPAELGGLANLEHLGLFNNQLSGPIPAELGGLTNLGDMRLQDNQLSGPIPAELGGLTNLDHLILGGNQLSGPIPAELGGLTNLVYLYLNDNQLSGPIPAELGGLTNLTNMWLQDNQLSGPIPAELGRLANLSALELSHNQLSGSIPAELGGLTNLVYLGLSDNQLSGPIPAELGRFDLGWAYLDNNLLTGCIHGGWQDVRSNDFSSVGLPFCDDSAGPELAVRPPWVSDASPSADEPFTLSATVRNQGYRESVPTTLRYYGSPDAEISTSDTQLDTDPVSALAASATSVGLIGLTAPSVAGTYYYGACVDAVPDEIDTTNNCSGAVIVIVRDGDTFEADAALPGVPTSGIFVPGVFSGASLSTGTGGTIMDFDDGGYIQLQDGTRYICRASDGCQVVNGAVNRGAFFSGMLSTSESAEDRAALVALYHATGGANWAKNANWLSDAPLGEWHGVTVDSLGRVIGLDLNDNRLSGSVPVELGGLASLVYLRLGGSKITGCIPGAWRDVPNNDFSSMSLPFCRGLGVGAALPGVPSSGLFSPGIISSASVSGGSGGTTIDFEDGGYIQLRDGTRYTCHAEGGCQVVNGEVARGAIELLLAGAAEDRAALVALYNTAGGASWTNKTNWMSEAPLGLWYGVTTGDSGRVTKLDLGVNGLTGVIPSEFGGLTSLTRLDLSISAIKDISPLAGLTSLTWLNLAGNAIEDISPLAGLESLTWLNLSDNAIMDVSPLISNRGLGGGAEIDIGRNPLNDESMDNYLSALMARGVTVIHSLRLVGENTHEKRNYIYNDNVIVMQVGEDLGTTAASNKLVAYASDFYHWFEDEFDYLLFLSNLNLRNRGSYSFPYAGVYRSVMNDVAGIGRQEFLDNRYGSAGQLRGVIHFPYLESLRGGPSLHELQHAWANYTVPTAVGGHWGFSSADGQLGGFDNANLVELNDSQWTAGSFGTFANGGNSVPYSIFELYLAGLATPDEVPDLWVAEDGEWVWDDNGRVSRTDDGDPIFTAQSVRTYSIADIVADHGERNPPMAEARRDQRAAVILLTNAGRPPSAADLQTLSEHATWLSLQGDDGNDYLYNYYEATYGRGTLTLDGLVRLQKSEAAPPANLPASFGVVPPPHTATHCCH